MAKCVDLSLSTQVEDVSHHRYQALSRHYHSHHFYTLNIYYRTAHIMAVNE